MTFAALGLIEPLQRTLDELDYKTPTPVQAAAIPAVLEGRDLMAAAQTGTGKTAGFALPVLQRLMLEGPVVASNSVRALVLVPTRELAEQVTQEIRRLARADGNVLKAADMLGVSRPTLYDLMHRLSIK